jgi:hypothetical protein
VSDICCGLDCDGVLAIQTTLINNRDAEQIVARERREQGISDCEFRIAD